MKKALQFLVLVAVLMISFTHDAEAQKRKRSRDKSVDEYFDDKGTFKDRIWYGADISIRLPRTGFSVGSDSYIGNLFFLGFSPMVGYKFNDFLSAGPRVEFNYQSARFEKFQPSFSSLPNELKSKSVNVGGGIFARAKIFQSYFLHVEYLHLGEAFISSIEDDKLVSTRIWDDHFYGGAGYNSDLGIVAFHASVLWDFSQKFTANNVPISYRAGLNFKF